jgi:CENP-B N-terminal DNA-binding domain
MFQRCTNAKNRYYDRYGGRGIVVCSRWRGTHGFANFLADVGVRPHGKTLDRFPDRDGNYEPGNVRWATATEQARTSSHTRLTIDLANEALGRIEHGESRRSVARRFGVSNSTIDQLARGTTWVDVTPIRRAA